MSTTISLTELRQRLFQLADHVAETGEPLLILRNGVRLRLVREQGQAKADGRLARLVAQSVVVGAPLKPHESPALWNDEPPSKVAEAESKYGATKRPRRGRRS